MLVATKDVNKHLAAPLQILELGRVVLICSRVDVQMALTDFKQYFSVSK
jgi:hypothetical protein